MFMFAYVNIIKICFHICLAHLVFLCFCFGITSSFLVPYFEVRLRPFLSPLFLWFFVSLTLEFSPLTSSVTITSSKTTSLRLSLFEKATSHSPSRVHELSSSTTFAEIFCFDNNFSRLLASNFLMSTKHYGQRPSSGLDVHNSYTVP